eukprot:UN19003
MSIVKQKGIQTKSDKKIIEENPIVKPKGIIRPFCAFYAENFKQNEWKIEDIKSGQVAK